MSKPIVEDMVGFMSSILDEIDVNDPAVSSIIASVLLSLNAPPSSSDDDSVNLQSC